MKVVAPLTEVSDRLTVAFVAEAQPLPTHVLFERLAPTVVLRFLNLSLFPNRSSSGYGGVLTRFWKISAPRC